MRTAKLALAYLDNEAALVEAARAVSDLTHWDHEAGDACVLWCVAIRRDRWIAAIPRPSATEWPSAATQSLGAAQRVATGRAGVGVVVDINGASAMVTGGASGIGAASVRQLAARGASRNDDDQS
jgi:hypothetical protein